jgi:hypothetical protein
MTRKNKRVGKKKKAIFTFATDDGHVSFSWKGCQMNLLKWKYVGMFHLKLHNNNGSNRFVYFLKLRMKKNHCWPKVSIVSLGDPFYCVGGMYYGYQCTQSKKRQWERETTDMVGAKRLVPGFSISRVRKTMCDCSVQPLNISEGLWLKGMWLNVLSLFCFLTVRFRFARRLLCTLSRTHTFI